MDSRTFDARQQLVRHDRMQVTDLAINQIGGGLTGGPGWINTVRYGSADMLPGQPNAANNAPAKADQLYCLHVKFEKSITGNILFRQVTFRDHVQATFAPVDSWDAMLTTNDPSRLGPKGAVASCDELQVFQTLLPFGGDRRAIELYALGNASRRHRVQSPRQPHHLRPGQGALDHRRRRPQPRRIVPTKTTRRPGKTSSPHRKSAIA